MLGLVVFVCTVAVVDSLNLSTIGPALYLATAPDWLRGMLGFVVGVFVVSTAAGLVLTLGPGQAVLAAVPRPTRRVTHLAELALGAAVVVGSLVVWWAREQIARKVVKYEQRGVRGSVLLGAGIVAVELPTALPYFAVIAAIVAGDQNVLSQIVLLVAFNGLFVAPLLVILAIRALARQRGIDALTTFRRRLHERAAVIIPAVVFLVGAALLLLGSIGIATE
jgi:cytochrome c biogenesis protein CcdA